MGLYRLYMIGMDINIRVVARARKNEVKKSDNGYKVYLTAAPVGGKANKALLETLAEYLNVKRSQLKLIKGAKSRDKVIKINRAESAL